MDRAELEMLASGVGGVSQTAVGEARLELLLRDREYAEQQEKSRRDFETALADKQLRAATDVSKATKRAAWAAAISAVSAIMLSLIAASQLWAFVESERASLTIYPTAFSGGLISTKPMEIAFDVKNGGKSAAHFDELRVVPSFDPLPKKPDYGEKTVVTLASVLPGGTTRFVLRPKLPDGQPLVPTQDLINRIDNGSIVLRLYGVAIYKDSYSWLFGNHALGFCFWYDPKSTDPILFANCTEPPYTFSR